ERLPRDGPDEPRPRPAVVLDGIVRYEAGGVGEEPMERNRPDLGVAGLDEMALERVGEAEATVRRLFDHERRGRHHLRERREIEDRGRGHRLPPRADRAMPGHDAMDWTLAPANDHHGAGDEPLGDRGFHPLVDRAESLGWHARDRIRHRAARAKRPGGAAQAREISGVAVLWRLWTCAHSSG